MKKRLCGAKESQKNRMHPLLPPPQRLQEKVAEERRYQKKGYLVSGPNCPLKKRL